MTTATRRSEVRATGPRLLESFNPATGELVGTVETITPDQVQGIVDDVAEVQPFWARALARRPRPLPARAPPRCCSAEVDEVAGCSRASRASRSPSATRWSWSRRSTRSRWIAEDGPEILADERITMRAALFLKTKRAKFTYEPIGVVGVIAPWNYPWSIPFGEVAIALMAGNGVVLKPASLTPLLGERIREIFEKAGLPEGLVRTVHGGGAVGARAGRVLGAGRSSSPARSRSAARSARPARRLMKGAVLELGGKDPTIVCADANLDQRGHRRRLGRLRQRRPDLLGDRARLRACSEVAEPFVEGVVRETERLTVGDPLELGDRDRADGLHGPARARHRARRRRGRQRRRAR